MGEQQGIYQIRNIVNGKVYIGSSVDILKRWREHKRALENNLHENKYLQRSWEKYGGDSFVFEKAEDVLRRKDVHLREQWFLDTVIRWGFDYNISKFSDSPNRGATPSPETRKKLSSARQGEGNPFWGKSHTQETKDLLSKHRLGKPITTLHRDNISMSQMGKKYVAGSSKYVGVSWDKARNKWAATIWIKRRKMFLGRFDSEIIAAQNYDLESVSFFNGAVPINFQKLIPKYRNLIKNGVKRIKEEIN